MGNFQLVFRMQESKVQCNDMKWRKPWKILTAKRGIQVKELRRQFFFFWIAGGNEVFIEGDKSAFFGIIK